MTDYPKALAAARKRVQIINSFRPELLDDNEIAIRDLVAALDAARGEAVRSELRFYQSILTPPRWSPWMEDSDAEQWAEEMRAKGRQVEVRHLYAAPPAAPRVERYGEGVLVHWPEGVEQYVAVGDCVTAPPAAAVPDGYALVPVEPTREMIEAGIMFGNSPNKAAIIWQNMLAAANKESTND